MKIIPAIDIIDGKCVRLTQGDYTTKKIYNENPVEVAKQFEAAGIEYLHVVDLDGAKSQHIINHKTLQAITTATKLKVDFGGGIKSDEDIRIAFDNGANQITAGSIAVKNRDIVLQWGKQYGLDKIIIGADVKDEQVAINGWQQSGNINLFDFLASYLQQGFSYVICTDIAKDGMLQGPSLQLYKKLLAQFANIKLIASGGVTNMNDVAELSAAGLHGAIIGKAIYEGTIDINQLVKQA